MRRKIACYVTAAATILFMVLRIVATVHPAFNVGTFSLQDSMIGIALIVMLATAVLCYSKSASPVSFSHKLQPATGWIATFCGAMLIMSIVLDVFCWALYHQVPPPNTQILNKVDLYTLIFSMVFGIGGGIYMILQGFNWMAETTRNRTLLSWLSLTPILWMWFRLARYEISYASTIDISESFFDFATLVTASLFFLQLARHITGMGAQPKNGLIILALFTTVCSLSGAPLTFYRLSQGAPISTLLIAIVDATIGLMAFVIALGQAFCIKDTTEPNEQDASFAWTTPAKEREPLDPPFSIDKKLPDVDSVIKEATESQIPTADHSLSVEDILAELDKDGLL